MHIVTKGLWAFPAKTFFVFAHNQPLDESHLKAHPLVNLLSAVKTQDQLLSLKHALLPQTKVIDFRGLSEQFDIDLVEF